MELGSHGKEQILQANNLVQLWRLPRGGHPRESGPPISIIHQRNHDTQPLSALSTDSLHDSHQDSNFPAACWVLAKSFQFCKSLQVLVILIQWFLDAASAALANCASWSQLARLAFCVSRFCFTNSACNSSCKFMMLH